MASNDWKDRLGMVYSTASDYQYKTTDTTVETLEPSKQDLRVWLDKKHRAGKVATIIKGFIGDDNDLRELAKVLKNRCGVGGSAKDGEIIIQGDHRDRVIEILTKSGYKSKKAGG
ncbi:MAG: translation initiation factor [Rikenellaceae bacterium]